MKILGKTRELTIRALLRAVVFLAILMALAWAWHTPEALQSRDRNGGVRLP